MSPPFFLIISYPAVLICDKIYIIKTEGDIVTETEEEEFKLKIEIQVYLEQVFKGHTITRCPKCNGEIIVTICGNSYTIKCPCGYMNAEYRGL